MSLPKKTPSVKILIKYGFSVILTILTILTTNKWQYCLLGITELLLLVLLTELLYQKMPKTATVVNIIASFLYNAQMMVLLFANSYVTLVMLTNLDSVEALSGKATQYIAGTILVFAFSLIPMKPILRKCRKQILLGICAVEAMMLILIGWIYSPFASIADLGVQQYQINQMSSLLNENADAGVFYSEDLPDFRKKDPNLPEKPNVILIFTEGLAQSVINDERSIMPNVAAFQKKSLSFQGYYNHTFATYRSLIGQLFSGYQFNNYDENMLISMQDIFADQGYYTEFINTEPTNNVFTKYLNTFGFDLVLTPQRDSDLPDKEAYELLLSEANKLNENQDPFFLTIYTFETHVSFDSSDVKYGDGTDPLLNRFHNMDTWFGNFLTEYENSGLAEDTIIVFTADHATFQDADFQRSFPGNQRKSIFLDEMPLCIYYPGIQPEEIQVSGRNTLDMAPTVLDYLDISAPNYFLGNSLFSEEGTMFDTVFCETYIMYSSKNGDIEEMEGPHTKETRDRILQYFSAKVQDGTAKVTGETISDCFSYSIKKDSTQLELRYRPNHKNDYSAVQFAVWSRAGDQDDLVWYRADRSLTGNFSVTIDAADHTTYGYVNVHIYGGEVPGEDFLENNVIFLDIPTPLSYIMSEDGKCLNVSFQPSDSESFQTIQFAVSNRENGQDDLVWYDAAQTADGQYGLTIDLKNHPGRGPLDVHVYETGDGTSTFIVGEAISVAGNDG